MVSEDFHIGFKEEPKGLDDFLDQEGYTRDDEQIDGTLTYTRKNGASPDLFYDPHPTKEEPEVVPNWEESDYKIVAELTVNYTFEDDAPDEALRLSKKLVEQFDAILFDTRLSAYFTKEDI